MGRNNVGCEMIILTLGYLPVSGQILWGLQTSYDTRIINFYRLCKEKTKKQGDLDDAREITAV